MKQILSTIARKWFSACKLFFKIMVPISVIIKILQELDQIRYIGEALSFLMYPLNLPGEMGLVWASAMLSNIYGGVLTYASLPLESPLNVAQMTTLASLVLFAHTFLIEIPICVKAGCRFLPIFLIRFAGAYIFAFIVAQSCFAGSWCQTPTDAFTLPVAPDEGLWTWIAGELKKYAVISLVVLALVVLLEIMDRLGITRMLERIMSPLVKLIGITRMLERIMSPLVKLIGISPKVMPITLIGMTLGLAYGGGLIVAQSREKPLEGRDIFLSLAFLSLFHSIIEDHLLMIALGAHWFWIFILRLVFTLGLMILIKHLSNKIPSKYLFREPK